MTAFGRLVSEQPAFARPWNSVMEMRDTSALYGSTDRREPGRHVQRHRTHEHCRRPIQPGGRGQRRREHGGRTQQQCLRHAGYKLGGIAPGRRGRGRPSHPMRPWPSVRSRSTSSPYMPSRDSGRRTRQCSRFGHAQRQDLDVRRWPAGAWDSLEIDAGSTRSGTNHALATHGRHALSQYEEISYVIFPWLVPAIRVEVSQVQPAGDLSIHDVRITRASPSWCGPT